MKVEAQAHQEQQHHQQAIASGSIAPDTPMVNILNILLLSVQGTPFLISIDLVLK